MVIEISNAPQAISVNVKAGDKIAIDYVQAESINISNYTDGSIFVSEKDNFEYTNNVGEFFVITDGNCYNEYIFFNKGSNKIYIKCDADGVVSIIRKQW